jgi:hypothetical protein
MFEANEAQRIVGELVAAMCSAAGESLAAAARVDLSRLDDDSLRSTVRALEAMRRSLDATACHAVSELHERRATREDGLATSAWLAREADQAAGVARERLSAGLKLGRHLPVVDDRLQSGRVGWQHVEVFARATNARNADAMGDASEVLCDLAEQLPFEEWREAVLAVGRRLDPDGAEPNDRSRSHLSVSPSEVFAAVHGVLVGQDAVIAVHALNDKADELFRAYAADRDQFGDVRIPPRGELLAEAFVELCRLANGVDADATIAPQTEGVIVVHTDGTFEDPGTPPELALDDLGPEGCCDGGHAHAHAHARSDRGVVVTTPDGLRVRMSDAAQMVCGAVMTVVAVNAAGQPLGDSRPVYRPSRRERRALALRDGGCTFPRCRIKAGWADAHHVRSWPQGLTELANLILLCRRHHGYVHHEGWSVELTEDGWTRWTSPRGATRWGQRHRRTRAGP